MKARQDLATGAVFFVFSAGLLLDSVALPAGAALLPRVALGALLLLSVLLVARGLRTASAARGSDETAPFMIAPGRLLIGVMAMAFYIAAIETVGFYPATAVFVPATAYALGARNHVTVLIGSVAFLIFAYVVFDVFFERVMPAGLLFAQVARVFAGAGHA
jgi:hypothetical protein